MQNIPKQTAMQALEIYRTGIDNGKGVAVDEKTGTVRVATIFDRFASKLAVQFSNINPSKVWAEKAKTHILHKFIQEGKLLKGGKCQQYDHSEFKSVVESILAQQTISGSRPADAQSTVRQKLATASEPVQDALINILDTHDNTSHKTLHFFWKAISQQKEPDIVFARAVANNAHKWKKEIGLSSKQAFKLAYDAQRLHSKQGIPPEAGMKILQNAGRLVNGHGLNRNDALQFAIDLHPLLMGELPLTLREIASMAELLEVRKAIPDDLPEITRLSAAICYFQQLKAHQNDASAIGIIQQRLVRMEYIQSKLPRGCTKDCIHQGAHIRSTYELNTSQLADFKSLTESFDISPTEHDEKLLKKAPKLKSLDPQFGIDATRAPFSATRAGNPDTSFTALELQKQNSFAKFINAKLSKWVDSYIEFAGGDNASKVLSRFTSQTIIGVMKTSTALATSTPDGLLCYAASSYGTTSFIYQMDRVDEVGKESVVVHNTAMFNAIALTIDQDFKDLEKIDNSIKSFELPLVPNAGDKKASEHTYSVRYDFKGSLARADLDADITTCTPLTVSVAYDLIIDEAELDQRQDSGEAMKLENQASDKIYFPKI